MIEEMLGRLPSARFPLLEAPLRSIWNVIRFYSVRSLLLAGDCHDEQIVPALSLGADGLVLSGPLNPTILGEAAAKQKRCFAGVVPVSDLSGESDKSEKAPAAAKDMLALRRPGFFLSTDWEVPASAGVDDFHAIMAAIRES
jgi:hypothetical protein